MADTKLSALTELAATPAADDELYIRDVSEAAATESKRITKTNLFGGQDVPTHGGGHITILPWNYSAIGQGTYILGYSATTLLNTVMSNYTGRANGDNISYAAYLSEGTYTLQFYFSKGADYGIVDIDVGGVEKGSQDCYAADALPNQVKTIAGIAVAAAALTTVRLRVDGKNGASSNYRFEINCIALWRTA